MILHPRHWSIVISSGLLKNYIERNEMFIFVIYSELVLNYYYLPAAVANVEGLDYYFAYRDASFFEHSSSKFIENQSVRMKM